MSTDVGFLIRSCMSAGATDVVLAPGTRIGKILIRSGTVNVTSQMVPLAALDTLARRIGVLASMAPFDGPVGEPFEVRLGSFEMEEAIIRVMMVMSRAGPLMRLRLQPMGLLQEARGAFVKGHYGGTALLKWLAFPRGLISLVGPASSGKTSLLHHVLHALPGRTCGLVSEAGEFKVPPGVRRIPLRELGGENVLAIDEMDEMAKLRLSVKSAADRLVVATLTAPNLGAAVQRLRSVLLGYQTPPPVLGFLRVKWDERPPPRELPGVTSSDPMPVVIRRPIYTWFALGRADGTCPACKVSVKAQRCPECGAHILNSELLGGVDDFSIFQEVENLD